MLQDAGEGRASEKRDVNRNQTTQSLAVKQVFSRKRLGDIGKWQPTEDGLLAKVMPFSLLVNYSEDPKFGTQPPMWYALKAAVMYVVPTGRVVVPTGRYVVPAGKVIIIVSPGSDNDSDDASVHSEATIPQQQRNNQPQYITTVSNNNAKFPYLKKDEYEVWAMKMEYWITNNDMNIWKVIQNGNNFKRTGRDCDGRVIILPPTTADEHIAVQRESKARTTLLQSIPDDHVADFHYMDDARDIWNAVKARFGGNAESKKMRKSMLKQEFSEFRISEAEGLHKGYDRMQKILSQLNQLKAKPEDKDINLKFLRALPSSWSQVALTLKTKGGLEFLSFDDLYYKLKTLEVDIKGYSTFSSSQSAGPSHSAFVSTTSASKKMSYLDSPCYSSSTYTAPSKTLILVSKICNVFEEVLQSFVLILTRTTTSTQFEQKAKETIDFDKKNLQGFNRRNSDVYKCLQRGHYVPKKAGQREEMTSRDIRHSRFRRMKFKKVTAQIYNLITGADTKEVSTAGDAVEFALVVVTSETQYANDSDGVGNHKVNQLLPLRTTFSDPPRKTQAKMAWDPPLDDFQEFQVGKVTFGGVKCRNTEKGHSELPHWTLKMSTILIGTATFPTCFSISHICDKKNIVLYTDTACLMLEPRSVAQALEDPSWVDAMQEEMQQFKFQNVWVLVDLPEGTHAYECREIKMRRISLRNSLLGNGYMVNLLVKMT
ncbi:hypothetical protein Tco_1132683, partial [Tanacetum coccineum]